MKTFGSLVCSFYYQVKPLSIFVITCKVSRVVSDAILFEMGSYSGPAPKDAHDQSVLITTQGSHKFDKMPTNKRNITYKGYFLNPTCMPPKSQVVKILCNQKQAGGPSSQRLRLIRWLEVRTKITRRNAQQWLIEIESNQIPLFCAAHHKKFLMILYQYGVFMSMNYFQFLAKPILLVGGDSVIKCTTQLAKTMSFDIVCKSKHMLHHCY